MRSAGQPSDRILLLSRHCLAVNAGRPGLSPGSLSSPARIPGTPSAMGQVTSFESSPTPARTNPASWKIIAHRGIGLRRRVRFSRKGPVNEIGV